MKADLATYENDHYELVNGEKRKKENPDTFFLPKKADRKSLQPHGVVKLIFCMKESKGSNNIATERMWVEVTGKFKDTYEGRLISQPAGSNCLLYGQTVLFKACHIIEIYEENK